MSEKDIIIQTIAKWLSRNYEPPTPISGWYTSEEAIENACEKIWIRHLNKLIENKESKDVKLK